MASSPSSDGTLEDETRTQKHVLDLRSIPPIFISETHLETEELHKLEDAIVGAGGSLTYDLQETKLVLTKAERKRRIQLDLRTKGCYTDEVIDTEETTAPEHNLDTSKHQGLFNSEDVGKEDEKAIVTEDDSTDSEPDEIVRAKPEPLKSRSSLTKSKTSVLLDPNQKHFADDLVKVLKLQWLEDSLRISIVQPIEPFLIYQGRRTNKPKALATPTKGTQLSTAALYSAKSVQTPQSVLDRAKADASENPFTSSPVSHGKRRIGQIGGAKLETPSAHGTSSNKRIRLMQQTTSEHDLGVSGDMPEMPEWVRQDVKYACQRATLAHPPNEAFIDLLKKIKLARVLTLDEIGVRAYSTSIASLAAYEHKISISREVLALPGCDTKIANLYVEYANTGRIEAAEDAENNEELKVLGLFYNVWGVGAATAREFYYERGWRTLEDLIDYGWSTVLKRQQQVGVKYYTEFLTPIPRSEVDEIAKVIRKHAVKVRDEGIQSLVVGGYRRRKDESGDVDVIVSHPDEEQTLNLVNDIVASLEEEGWVTHTLIMSLTTSERGQQTLPFVTGSGGHGFDSLDKALVVWQNPDWPTKEADLASNPKAKNPNIHRRVDIIISPWKTAGCAVMGWSGGTTFQRDLRRYAKYVKGWKFDSSGVRDRNSGQTVDVDGYENEKTRAHTLVDAEKTVFKNLGLEWREPWERCTG